MAPNSTWIYPPDASRNAPTVGMRDHWWVTAYLRKQDRPLWLGRPKPTMLSAISDAHDEIRAIVEALPEQGIDVGMTVAVVTNKLANVGELVTLHQGDPDREVHFVTVQGQFPMVDWSTIKGR